MSRYLGIDTSNYTTSVALFDSETKTVISKKKLLPVKPGERGIRQSDAVFHHTQQIRELLLDFESLEKVETVTVSIRPRFQEDSYMPCFTVGQTVATAMASVQGAELYEVSHQEGHIMAALYSADKLDLLGQEFLAFHVSGGTTESLLVKPSERCLVSAKLIGTSNDLKAGQAVDRVGLMLGLNFPCGPELEKLALLSKREFGDIKASLSGFDCSLSGVENKCKAMLDKGEPKEDIALFCLLYIEEALKGMLSSALEEYKLPVVFSGGVMSNSILQKDILKFANVLGVDAYFAEPQYSSDNAVGVALLGCYKN